MPANNVNQYTDAERSISASKLLPFSLLASFNLDRLAKRLVSEDGLKDRECALRVIEEYKKFFWLMSEWVEEDQEQLQGVFLPPPVIDLVWQRHMLDTRNYFADCERYLIRSGYLHRHELRSKFDIGANSGAHPPVDCDVDASAAYKKTLDRYALMYGCSPPADIWPAEISGKSYVSSRARDGAIWLPYASPLVSAPVCDIENDKRLPHTEEALMSELMWVGNLVYDALPRKQIKCQEGETLMQVSFPVVGTTRDESVRAVVKEYARFMLLILSDEKSKTENAAFVMTEKTPPKIVDELWHAHILHSPSYISFW